MAIKVKGVTVIDDNRQIVCGVITASHIHGDGSAMTNISVGSLTGSITGASLSGTLPALDGSNLTNLPSASGNGNLTRLVVSGISTMGNIESTGVVTATSFSGDGSALTGIGGTANVSTNTLSVSGVSTFNEDIKLRDGKDIFFFDSSEQSTGRIFAGSPAGVYMSATRGILNFSNQSTTGTNAGQIKLNCHSSNSIEQQVGGTTKLQVNGSGIDVTGIVTATSFSGDGSALTNLPSASGNASLTQLVVSGIATFQDKVSIAGTLTYEDVTNVDSVGLITARSGIDISGKVSGYDYLQAPYGSTVSFTVTIGAKSNHRYQGQGSSLAYYIDGVESPFLTLTPGRTYRFVHDNTGSHPLKFYLDPARTTLYSTGVNFQNTYTEITVTDTTPTVLHYQCTNHAYMGNAVGNNSNVVDVLADATLRQNLSVSGVSTFAGVITSDSNITTTADVTGRYLYSEDIFIEGASPEVRFTDNDENPDYRIRLNGGSLTIRDITNNADKLTFNTSGVVAIGTAIFQNKVLVGDNSLVENNNYGPNITLQVGDDTSAVVDANTYSSSFNGAFELLRARGTGASPSSVQDGDKLGDLNFFGYNSTGSSGDEFMLAAQIGGEVDGTPGSGDQTMPAALTFKTATSSTGNPTERLRIGADGKATFSGAVEITSLSGSGSVLYNTGSGTLSDSANLTYTQGTATLNGVNLDLSNNLTVDSNSPTFTKGFRAIDNSGVTLVDISGTGTAATAFGIYDGSSYVTTLDHNGAAQFSGIVTATSFSGDGSSLTGVGGGAASNMVDNGEFLVNQRGESSYTTSGGFTFDRWYSYYNATPTFTFSQSTDAPAGFENSLKIECTALSGTPPSYQYGTFSQAIEGYHSRELCWTDSSNAKNATLSFYAKASNSGTWCVTIADYNGSHRYVATYTIASADTWERITINIPAPSSGTWKDDNNKNLVIYYDLGAGSMWQTSTPNTWINGSSIQSTSSAFNMANNLNSYIYLTGIQLEVGDSASDYVYEDYQDALIRAKRYYKRLFVFPDNSSSQNLIGEHLSATVWKYIDLDADLMRANPSISLINNSDIEVQTISGTWGSGNNFNSGTMGTFPNLQAYVYRSSDSSAGVTKRVRKTTSGDVIMQVSADIS